jgi:hypothetical protein
MGVFVSSADFLFLERADCPGERLRTCELVDRGAAGGAADLFPGRAGRACWHCCHPCEPPATLAMPMPIAYDHARDAFTVVGTFCSFACMKTFNGNRLSAKRDTNYLTLALFVRRFYGRYTRIAPAPQRVVLAAFGGALSIEEFRARSREPPAPARPFARAGEPTVVLADDDSHRITVVPHAGDSDRAHDPGAPPRREKARRAPSASAAAAGGAAPAAAATAAKRKKKEPAPGPAPPEDAMLKLKRSDDGDGGAGGAGAVQQRDILATLMGLTFN